MSGECGVQGYGAWEGSGGLRFTRGLGVQETFGGPLDAGQDLPSVFPQLVVMSSFCYDFCCCCLQSDVRSAAVQWNSCLRCKAPS